MSVGVDYLAKKWDQNEDDLKAALAECGFVVPNDEDAIITVRQNGEVTGIFTVPDPEDPFWGGDRRLVATGRPSRQPGHRRALGPSRSSAIGLPAVPAPRQ